MNTRPILDRRALVTWAGAFNGGGVDKGRGHQHGGDHPGAPASRADSTRPPNTRSASPLDRAHARAPSQHPRDIKGGGAIGAAPKPHPQRAQYPTIAGKERPRMADPDRVAAGIAHTFSIMTPDQRAFANRLLADTGNDPKSVTRILAAILTLDAQGRWPGSGQAGTPRTEANKSGTHPDTRAPQGARPRAPRSPLPPARPRRPADDDRE